MEQKQQASFMDPKTILAIVLVGLAWLFWDSHMKEKYPQLSQNESSQGEGGKNKAENVEKSVNTVEDRTGSAQQGAGSKEALTQKLTPEVSPERIFSYEDGIWSFDLSSHGMSVKNIVLKNYKDRQQMPKKLGHLGNKGNLETKLIGHLAPLNFDLVQRDKTHFIGTALVGQMVVTKLIEVDSDKFSLITSVKVSGYSDRFEGLSLTMGREIEASTGSSILTPFGKPEVFVDHVEDTERVLFPEDQSEDEQLRLKYSKIILAGLSSQYFTLAVLDQSDVMPSLKTRVDRDLNSVVGLINYRPLNKATSFETKYVGFIGPKSTEILKKVDEKLLGLVDFGMFSFFGHYILKLMKFFYQIVGNWGWAIILLTFVVRLLLLPINLSSQKSMKAMQKIQPELKKIREKFKDDPQRLNKETMGLMKEAKANPIGGCLPMLLQLPVFIALYQVLGQSVELYQAPFGLWITDLSLKDPFYVLPVLMGLTMFFQQKITPTTMDPAQAKIMMFMPLVFCFFMVSLPSGLTLYIFISSLFGVFQQMYFMKEKVEKKVTVVV